MEQRDKERVAGDILDAVISCKRDAAGGDISITQVAARAGMSDRTLNRYFPDKERMVYLAAVRYLISHVKAISDRYVALDKTGLNGRQRLVQYIRTHVDHYRADMAEALLFVSAHACCISTAVGEKLRSSEYDTLSRQILFDCVERGVQDGSIRSDAVPLDVYLLVSSNFTGLVHRLVFLYSVDQTEPDQRKAILSIFDKYLLLDDYLRPERAEELREEGTNEE